jgi:hypothetical protein
MGNAKEHNGGWWMASPFSRAAFPAARGARYFLAAALFCSLFAGHQPSVEADSQGGQASSYTAAPQSINLFSGWSPTLFNNVDVRDFGQIGVYTAISVNNPTTSTQVAEFIFKRAKTGEIIRVKKAIPPGDSLYYSNGTQVAVPTATNTPTALPTNALATRTSTAVATGTPLATAVPATSTPVGSPTVIPTAVPSATDQFFGLPNRFEGTVTATGVTRDFTAAIVYGIQLADFRFEAFEVFANPSCSLSSPLFMNGKDGWSSSLSLFNETTRSTELSLMLKGLNQEGGEGPLYARSLTLPARATRQVLPSDLSLPDGFEGSIQATACPIKDAQTLRDLSPNQLATIARSTGEISGVVKHEKSDGDAMSAAMTTIQQTGDHFFLPLAYNDFNGWKSRVVLFNTDRIQNPLLTRDLSVKATFFMTEVAPGEPTQVEQNFTIRRESPLEIDLTKLPKGVMSILLEGPSQVLPTSNYTAASYHYGPNGAAAALVAVESDTDSTGNFDLTKNFFPVLYRAAGSDQGWNSGIRVVKLGRAGEGGSFSPRITFWDRANNEQIGPLSSNVNLRTGEAFTWNLSAIEQLKDNHVYSALVEGDVVSSSGDARMVSVAHHYHSERQLSELTNGYSQRREPEFRNRDLTAPLVMKNVNGLNSAIALQNLTGDDQSVNIRFRNAGGSTFGNTTVSIPVEGSTTLYLPSIADLPDGFIGAAEIDGNGAIAAEVNTVRYRP